MSFIRQSEKPIFEDIFWSRPERTDLAGKLLVLGGNRDSLAAPMRAFTAAEDAGAGQVSVFLPDALKTQLGNAPGIDYLPSTINGAFSKKATGQILAKAADYDMLLLAGDFAKSSETTQLLEELSLKTPGQLTICGDAIDLLLANPEALNKGSTTLVINPGQMQKLVSALKIGDFYKTGLSLDAFSGLLEKLAGQLKSQLVVLHSGHLWVLASGQISASKRQDIKDETTWQTEQAARSSVFLLQHKDQIFEALTSSVFALEQDE